MYKLNFLLSTNGIYNNFISPFIFFANYTNPKSSFQIYITDQISKNLKQQINFLKILNIPIKIIQKNYNISPQYLRFFIEPKTQSEYTYIADSDILICEPILDFHITQMKKFNNLYYDNVTRDYQNQSNRMSGLHFVKTKQYYQKTKQIRQNLLKNFNNKKLDEFYLFDICYISNIFINYNCNTIKKFNIARPIHGNVSHLDYFKNKFLEIILTRQFQYLLTLNPKFKNILEIYKKWENF